MGRNQTKEETIGGLIRSGANEYPDWPAVMRRMREVDPKE
jgi:hypothetical protein